jgi:DUF1680 family protein
MNLSNPAHISLGGDEGRRLALSIEHLLQLNTEEMWREFEDPDPIWHWGADYAGRWIATMSLLSRHTGVDYGVEPVARRLIGYQRPDGSYGDFTAPHGYKEWFGMGRGLVGLLEYSLATGDRQAFASARRLGEYYISHYPRLTPYMYECYSNALEGIVLLARHTGENRFLELAHTMARTSMVFQRVWYSTTLGENGRRSPCGGQVHCQLMTARGLLDLAELTGDMTFVAPVLELHQHICDRVLSLAGGVGIYFNRPEENEACADADWLRLNLQLWRMTGERTYLEFARNTLTNQIPFSQASNGAYCYLRGLQNRSGNAFDVCCSHHVPRAMWEVMRYATTSCADSEVWVNLFLEGTFEIDLRGANFAFQCERFHEGSSVLWRYIIRCAPSEPMSFGIRKPDWADRVEMTVNGDPVDAEAPAAGPAIERVWGAGDVVDVRFPNLPRLTTGHTIGRQLIHGDEAAVLYGPRVYALSDLHNPTVDIHTVRILVDAEGQPNLSNSSSDLIEADGISIDGTPGKLVFSPISETGGNPNGIGRSHPALAAPFRVWIRVEEAADARRA